MFHSKYCSHIVASSFPSLMIFQYFHLLLFRGLRVFCVGSSCFLRRLLVFVFFATVPVGGVFCNGGGCFLHQ